MNKIFSIAAFLLSLNTHASFQETESNLSPKIQELDDTINTLSTEASISALMPVFEHVFTLSHTENFEVHLRELSKFMGMQFGFYMTLTASETTFHPELFKHMLHNAFSTYIQQGAIESDIIEHLETYYELGQRTIHYFFDHIKTYHTLYNNMFQKTLSPDNDMYNKQLVGELFPIYEGFFNDFFHEIKRHITSNHYLTRKKDENNLDIESDLSSQHSALTASLIRTQKQPLRGDLSPLVEPLKLGQEIVENLKKTAHHSPETVSLIKSGQMASQKLMYVALARHFQATYLPIFSPPMPELGQERYKNHAIRLTSIFPLNSFDFITNYHFRQLETIKIFYDLPDLNLGLSLYSNAPMDAANVQAIATSFMTDAYKIIDQAEKYHHELQQKPHAIHTSFIGEYTTLVTSIKNDLGFEQYPILFKKRLDEITDTLEFHTKGMEHNKIIKTGKDIYRLFAAHYAFLEASVQELISSRDALNDSDKELWTRLKDHEFAKNTLYTFKDDMGRQMDMPLEETDTPWNDWNQFEMYALMNEKLQDLILNLVEIIAVEKLNAKVPKDSN